MHTDKQAMTPPDIVRIHWKRDPDTFNLLSVDNGDEKVVSSVFPLGFHNNADAWYEQMEPADSGKELWLLKEVYKKGKGVICYAMRGLDGSRWQVTETMEMRASDSGKDVIYGKWVCQRK